MKITPRRAAWLAALCLGSVQAQDSWTGPDKAMHFGGSAVLGVVASGMTDSRAKAFAGCLAVGLGKELTDASGGEDRRFSGKDLLADAAGCALGVTFGRFVASRSNGTTTIAARWEF